MSKCRQCEKLEAEVERLGTVKRERDTALDALRRVTAYPAGAESLVDIREIAEAALDECNAVDRLSGPEPRRNTG